MQVKATSSASQPAVTTASTSTSKEAFNLDAYLTDDDLKMLQYVTGTSTLSAAETNANAKTLAASIGSARKEGKLNGSAGYLPAQLTESDAKLVQNLTGTNNIIDAAHTSSQSTSNLLSKIAADRKSGALKGDLTASYFTTIRRYDLDRLIHHHFKGVSVSFGTVNNSINYLQSAAFKAYQASAKTVK